MQDDILAIALELSESTRRKIADLDQIMMKTKILTMNARLEAARAGDAGKSFAVVAQEMGAIAGEVNDLSAELQANVADNASRIREAGEGMALALRGTRLSDLARNAVEIIDRNLYERSCDVRWWATDSAVVDALEQATPEAAAHASTRLATILRSYTVYLDLWIADRQGRIVASGRPERYRGLAGADVSGADWFRRGLQTATGDDFAVCDIASEARLGNAAVATYSTAIRAGGQPGGAPIGVLGIFFDWAPQARTIVDSVSLSPEERENSQIMLLDSRMRIIACNRRDREGQVYPLKAGTPLGHYQAGGRLVGYGLTPGYETYRGLGWYGCIESALS